MSEVRLHTLLPAIFLSNKPSLCKKLDDLQLLVARNGDFSASSVPCFTEMRLCGLTPDSALQLVGLQFLSIGTRREIKGRGTYFLINKRLILSSRTLHPTTSRCKKSAAQAGQTDTECGADHHGLFSYCPLQL